MKTWQAIEWTCHKKSTVVEADASDPTGVRIVGDFFLEEDAALAAAAPALLEALKAYQDEIRHAAINATRPRLSVLNRIRLQAADAIGKAERSAT